MNPIVRLCSYLEQQADTRRNESSPPQLLKASVRGEMSRCTLQSVQQAKERSAHPGNFDGSKGSAVRSRSWLPVAPEAILQGTQRKDTAPGIFMHDDAPPPKPLARRQRARAIRETMKYFGMAHQSTLFLPAHFTGLHRSYGIPVFTVRRISPPGARSSRALRKNPTRSCWFALRGESTAGRGGGVGR